MNIKELETATGIARANIRYYEQEGLLSPTRQENGYRDYRQEDLETLLRIKLLRQLQFSLDEIRKLQRGEMDFSSAMEQHSRQLGLESQDLAVAQRVCREMGQEIHTFAELPADIYLERLTRSVPTVPDEELPTPHPWRRYFARTFDLGLVSLVLIFLRYALFHAPLDSENSFSFPSSLLSWLLILLVEPLWIHFLGTTPGKWVWGIRVEAYGGGKLGLWDAYRRTFGVLLAGNGLCIPIADMVCNIFSYRKYVRGEELYWESDSVMRFRERRWVSPVLHVGSVGLYVSLVVLAFLLSMLPPRRGDLTIENFAKNFNSYRDYMGYDDGFRLDSEGNWTRTGPVRITLVQQPQNPEFVFEVENGTIRSVSYTLELPQQEEYIELTNTYAKSAYLALASAQPGTNVINVQEFFRTMRGWNVVKDFTCQWKDVSMTYTADIEGFYIIASSGTADSGILTPKDEDQNDNHIFITFQAEIQS